MKRRLSRRTKPASQRPWGPRRKTRSGGDFPIGLTLHYYPHTQRLTPTLSDPEIERLVRRSLAKARELLARRGSAAIIKCVLFEVAHGEVFWLDEGN